MCSTRFRNYTTQHATEKERRLSVRTSAPTESFIDSNSSGFAPTERGSDLEEAHETLPPFLLIGPAQLSFESEEKFAS